MTIPNRCIQFQVRILIVLLLFMGFALNGNSQVLEGPDPHQMEDAPDLGFMAVVHGLKFPAWCGLGKIIWWSSTEDLIR